MRLGKKKEVHLLESHKWDSLGEDGEVAWIAAELEGGEKLSVALEVEQILSDFCFCFA